jgi:hypothetical protein
MKNKKASDKNKSAINLNLLQLALNNCESSVGPKKWQVDQSAGLDKF